MDSWGWIQLLALYVEALPVMWELKVLRRGRANWTCGEEKRRSTLIIREGVGMQREGAFVRNHLPTVGAFLSVFEP